LFLRASSSRDERRLGGHALHGIIISIYSLIIYLDSTELVEVCILRVFVWWLLCFFILGD